MKNVKFRGKKTNSAANSAAQIPRHSAGRGKLWALVMMTLPAMCFCCVDFQKVAALILALFHLQRYYRLLQKRLNNTLRSSLQETFQVYGSTTFSQDPRDKFT